MKVFLKKRSTVAESRLKSEILTFFENKKPQNKPIGFSGTYYIQPKPGRFSAVIILLGKRLTTPSDCHCLFIHIPESNWRDNRNTIMNPAQSQQSINQEVSSKKVKLIDSSRGQITLLREKQMAPQERADPFEP